MTRMNGMNMAKQVALVPGAVINLKGGPKVVVGAAR